jgi:hypothetical protein
LDGYIIPLVVQARNEWDSLPHAFLTAEEKWDPTVMYHMFKEDEPWRDYAHSINGNKCLSPFDDSGNYLHRLVVPYTDFFQSKYGSIDLDDIIDQCAYYAHQRFVEEDLVVFYDANEHEIDSNNNDDIHGPTIIPTILLNKNKIIHPYIHYVLACLLILSR